MDYVATAIIAAIAVGIGNFHLVQVKRNCLESPILYMTLLDRPGVNKSHPLSFTFQRSLSMTIVRIRSIMMYYRNQISILILL